MNAGRIACLLPLLAAVAGLAHATDEPAPVAGPPGATAASAPLRIGVAPFEGVAGPDALLPDLASFLSARLARAGGVEVVDPGDLGAPAVLEPEAAEVRRWAERAGLDAVVVGRTTRATEAVSLDLRLRSGVTGEVVDSWFREMPSLDEAPQTIDALVPELVAQASSLRSAPPPPKEADRGHFGLSVDSDQPLAIRSDELEAFQNQGARRLVFTQNVVVTQADVTIRADRLEALYPAGSKKPDRLAAAGHVVMTQAGREAHCDEAVYVRVDQKLVCRGHAELIDGEDRVAGEEISFDLAGDTVTVTGRAAVVFQPRAERDARGDEVTN